MAKAQEETANIQEETAKIIRKPPNPMNKKIRIIERLMTLGIETDDAVKKLTPSDFISGGFSFDELALIHDLQIAIRNNAVYSFLVEKAG